MVDLEPFRRPVLFLHAVLVYTQDRDGVAECDRLLSIIDSAGKVEAQVLARGWFHRLPDGDYDFHDEASGAGNDCSECVRCAIVRDNSTLVQQPAAVVDEAARLLAICQNAHDRLLRGDDDSELLAILEQAWMARKALEAGNG